MTPQLPFESDAGASQAQRILEALQSGRRLTPIDALREFNCFRLGGRIWDLKKQGHPIESEWVEVRTGKRVKRYFLDLNGDVE